MMRFERLISLRRNAAPVLGSLLPILLALTASAAGVPSDTAAPQAKPNSPCSSLSRDFGPDGKLPKEVLDDMRGHSEALPNGAIAPNRRPFDWAVRPNVNLGNRPSANWTAIIPTGMIYAVGKPAKDMPRVQIKDLRLYVRMEGSDAWRLIDHTHSPHGGFYREDFARDDHVGGSVRNESSGGISVRLPPGRNFHFYATHRTLLPQGKITGVYARFDARLIDGQGRPYPNRGARYVASASADYWRDLSATWAGVGVHNDYAAIGKFKLLRGQWRAFSMHTVIDGERL